MLHLVALGYLIFLAVIQTITVVTTGLAYVKVRRDAGQKVTELASQNPNPALTNAFKAVVNVATAPLRKLLIRRAAFAAVFVAAVAVVALNV